MSICAALFFLIAFLRSASCGVLECTSAADCVAPDATCTGNLCECPFGRTFGTDGTSCLEYVTHYRAECVDSAQCAWLLGNYVCKEGRCECDAGWRWLDGRCRERKSLGDVCQEDVECYNEYDQFAMVCGQGRCVCAEGYYLRGDYDCRPEATAEGDQCALDSDCRADNTRCLNARCQIPGEETAANAEEIRATEISTVVRAIEEACETDSDCADTPLAVCSPLTKKCACKRGYFLSQGSTCAAELGVDVGCTEDADCPIKPGRCVEGACYCAPFWFQGSDMQKCHKSMTQTNWNCTSTEWCYALGPNVQCNEGCRCSEGYKLDEYQVCRQSVSGNECGNCDTSSNFECIQGECLCKEGFREENKKCLPNIGSDCDDSFPCTLDDAYCGDSKKCVCREDFVAADELRCLRVAASLGDECDEDLQCTEAIPNTQCSDNRCVCGSQYVDKNNSCFESKQIGSYCSTRKQCTIVMSNSVACRNSKCQCPLDMEATQDGLDCRTSGAGFISSDTICGMILGFVALRSINGAF